VETDIATVEMHMVFQSETQEISVIGVYIDVASDPAPAVVQAPAAGNERRGRYARGQEQQLARRQNGTVAAPGAPTVLLETVFSVVDAISTPGTKVETPPLVMKEVVDIVKAGSFQA